MIGERWEKKSDEEALRAAEAIEGAVAEVLKDRRYHTPDLNGKASTGMVGDAVAGRIRAR